MRAAASLRAWYRPRRHAYPWRGSSDPYAVLVSEVMLQQTQAPRVVAAFGRFLAEFPTVHALAVAPRAQVIRAWGGLGYNRRAVALSRSAFAIVRDHDGRVPADPDVLRTLPGVGPYTAAAVASLAYGVAVPALDTNVRRVVARVRLGTEAGDVSASRLHGAADEWLDREDPGGWNQALMDLGREVCRPRPRCDACPIAEVCRFRAAGTPLRPVLRRQGPFEGSSRQLRGAVVRSLRSRPSRTLAGLATDLGIEPGPLRIAIEALQADGLVVAGAAALEGRPGGRVRLAT